MEEEIKKIFIEIFEKEETNTDLYTQENIEKWDSMGHLRLMVSIESEFDLSIEPEDSVLLTSYAKIVEYISKNV